MRELAHGDYELKLEGNIVHCFPKGGFNRTGIIALRSEIIALAPKNQSWVLFEHPLSEAGLTPDGATELYSSYTLFEKMGCKAVALEICSTWQYIIEKLLTDELTIPVYFDNDSHILTAKLNQVLASKQSTP
ncbi:hypothetical protein HII17_00335 [Thalassotalea sp. M1531]|uniref:Uncharacterized protein n=1 Tax=Thalassotalea algicola TaxID=2716224 RepID=A0A7Y0L8Z2_9GAMM|nr:hypothetical protein [Thalassotalea algicola]NMP29992.1 hypothetical protein [Thalassotalea algicola]